MERLMDRLRNAQGHVSLYYRPLEGGCSRMYNADEAMKAASVIKIPIMIEAFRQFEAGTLAPNEKHVLREEEKKPSCGALNRLHAGLEVTMRDLVELMIVLSDNTATNILIDRLGIDAINANMRALGLQTSVLKRKMFDATGKAAGLQNYVSAREIGMLLEEMYFGRIVSEKASREMLEILRNQKLNGKMPFALRCRGIEVAHKTGEDAGTTHDVGIVYAKKPFVLCMLSNDTYVPEFERIIQDAALILCETSE